MVPASVDLACGLMKEPLCSEFLESSYVLGPMFALLSPNTLCCISDHMFCQKSQAEQGNKAVLCHLPFQFPSAALRHIHRLLSFILFSMSVIHLLFMSRCSFLPLTPRKQPKIFCSSCKTNTLKKKAWCKISGVQQCGDVLLAWALNKQLENSHFSDVAQSYRLPVSPRRLQGTEVLKI